jgi:hypothetical protein
MNPRASFYQVSRPESREQNAKSLASAARMEQERKEILTAIENNATYETLSDNCRTTFSLETFLRLKAKKAVQS